MNKKLKRCGWLGCLAALGFVVAATSGCQTNMAGMTLPSGHYLQHLPDYVPPSPPYPFSHELQSQQTIAAQPQPGGGEALPPPLP